MKINKEEGKKEEMRFAKDCHINLTAVRWLSHGQRQDHTLDESSRISCMQFLCNEQADHQMTKRHSLINHTSLNDYKLIESNLKNSQKQIVQSQSNSSVNSAKFSMKPTTTTIINVANQYKFQENFCNNDKMNFVIKRRDEQSNSIASLDNNKYRTYIKIKSTTKQKNNHNNIFLIILLAFLNLTSSINFNSLSPISVAYCQTTTASSTFATSSSTAKQHVQGKCFF